MQVLSVQIGSVAPLFVGTKRIASAFRKTAVSHAVPVQALGLVGDEQADLSVHGGLSKAVYAYPSEHYPFWQNLINEHRAENPISMALAFGALGENLSLQGLLESDVFVGDELHFPHCVLRVTEPRQPCDTFCAALQFPKAAKHMAQSGYSGFYLAVQQAGQIQAGDKFELVHGQRQNRISDLFQKAMFKTRND